MISYKNYMQMADTNFGDIGPNCEVMITIDNEYLFLIIDESSQTVSLQPSSTNIEKVGETYSDSSITFALSQAPETVFFKVQIEAFI